MNPNNHRELLIFDGRGKFAKVAVITRMRRMHLDAYARYQKSLIHDGGKP